MSARRHILETPPANAWLRRGALWECPACSKRFPRAGQTHSCHVVTLEHHFRNRPRARELFEAFVIAVEEAGGPVRLSIAKTRIGLINTLTFAAITPRKRFLRGHILLRRKVRSTRFVRIEDGPPYWVHHFEIRDEVDLDDELKAWLGEASRAQ